jgi:hypothetical protein
VLYNTNALELDVYTYEIGGVIELHYESYHGAAMLCELSEVEYLRLNGRYVVSTLPFCMIDIIP